VILESFFKVFVGFSYEFLKRDSTNISKSYVLGKELCSWGSLVGILVWLKLG